MYRTMLTAVLFAGLARTPRLVRFDGVVPGASGQLPVTFTFYEQEQGGAPLWSETQTIQLNNQGRHSVLLGTTDATGLPQDLFTGNKARWIGVLANQPGAVEQPRILLLGVPYALKASDAETLGGKPAASY